MNVSLTPDLERFVREKVESGLYNSASEVVREALRLLLDRDRDEAAYRVSEAPAGAYAAESDEPASLRVAAARFRQAIELLQLSYSLMEQNLRREHPEASEARIEERLGAWKTDADWSEEAPGHLRRSPERLEKLRRAAD